MSDTPPDRADFDVTASVAPSSADTGGNGLPPSAGVSMMITRRQRAALVALGFTEAAIHVMSPAEAHATLISRPDRPA